MCCLAPAAYSIYDWNAFSFLWTPVTCLLANVTYAHRVDQPGVGQGAVLALRSRAARRALRNPIGLQKLAAAVSRCLLLLGGSLSGLQ